MARVGDSLLLPWCANTAADNTQGSAVAGKANPSFIQNQGAMAQKDIIHGSPHLGPTCMTSRQGSRGMRVHKRLREQVCMLEAQPHDTQKGVMKGSCTGTGNAAHD